MEKEDLLKIRSDVKDILYKHGTRCLCGHDEWCEGCSPSSTENRLFNEVMDYFDKLIE
jgi:hypothetical protein